MCNWNKRWPSAVQGMSQLWWWCTCIIYCLNVVMYWLCKCSWIFVKYLNLFYVLFYYSVTEFDFFYFWFEILILIFVCRSNDACTLYYGFWLKVTGSQKCNPRTCGELFIIENTSQISFQGTTSLRRHILLCQGVPLNGYSTVYRTEQSIYSCACNN